MSNLEKTGRTGYFKMPGVVLRYFSAVLLVAALFLSFVAVVYTYTRTQGRAYAATSSTLNFQARLANINGASVPDGLYNIRFKLYDTATNGTGTNLWTEQYYDANGVTAGQDNRVRVVNGYFSVNLGSQTAFGAINWDQELWLTMDVGGTTQTATPTYDGEMLNGTQRTKLTAVPYAFRAGALAQFNLGNGYSSTLSIASPTGGNQTFTIADQGAAGSYTLCTTNTCAVGAGTAFLQSGNSFGAAANLGTNDNNVLNFRTNGTTKLTVTTGGDLTFAEGANRTLSVATATSGTVGYNLTVSAGNAFNGAGGNLTLQGGNAATAGNGGDITILGGNGAGSGVQGLVNIGPAAFRSVTNSSCGSNCTLTQANVDNYGTVLVNATASGITITLPDPTRTADIGRIIYITAVNGSSDFTLNTNAGGSLISVAMRQNTTATMIWNGTDWTPGGASNATTLQATYNNGTNPSTVPEIKLDSSHGTIDIQDADISIGADLFAIHASNSSTLGTVLFGVSNTGRVSVQNVSDPNSSFRVLDSGGNYSFNINAATGFTINNTTRPIDNAIQNPSFEAGGNITGGEQGWIGSSQATIVNDSSNAHAGNYELQVAPNGATQKVYNGGYYAVLEGDVVYVEGYVKNAGGTNGTGGVIVEGYDKDKAFVGSSTDAALPGTSYVLKKVTYTVPSGVKYIRVGALVNSSATTGTYYFDDFYMRASNRAPAVFQNTVDSTAAFQIQSASASQTLFTADTTNNIIKIGDSTGTNTATTILVVDSATADPTSLSGKNGGLFYRSDTGSLKAIINGAVVDVCTTAVTCSGYSASASSSIQLQASSPGTAQTGNFNITGTGILTQLQTQDVSSASTNSSNLVIRTGNATGSTSNSGSLTFDIGSATGTRGSITIGSTGVTTYLPGGAFELGTASTNAGSIKFFNSVGGNSVTIVAPAANPTSSYTLTLPQNLSSSGYCLKDSGSGALVFQDCGAGATVTMQNTYDNSSPATITLANSKDLSFVAQDTSTDPSVIVNLQCTTCSSNGGRFVVQNGGTDVFFIKPNSGGIFLNTYTQLGSATTDTTQVNLQLDSFSTFADNGSCTTTTNQGAMYYNTNSHAIRSCADGAWTDLITQKDINLFLFGVVPDSGTNPGDLPSLVTSGASGPCRASWNSANSVSIQSCVAYSGGRRVKVSSTTLTITTTTTNLWQHVCLTGTDNQPALTTAATTATANMPTFSVTAPILCLADIKNSASTNATIDDLYDTRTFTTTTKDAVTASTAVELGMLVDISGSNIVPAVSASQKLYGIVVATNGSTSTTSPNAIVAIVGPSFAKINGATNAGDFIKTNTTNGYGIGITAIPNNSFYFSIGNARNTYDTTCSTAANCRSSVYVNLVVR